MQSRRSLLGKLGGLSVGIGTLAVARTGRASCAATPAQMAGPFYPEPGQSWEDGDLTTRRGSSQVAAGEPIINRGSDTRRWGLCASSGDYGRSVAG